MKLYHVTVHNRLESIRYSGLLIKYSDPRLRIKGVWVCTQSRIAWAVLHTQAKHRVALEQVVVLEVEVQRSQVRRFRAGLWVSETDISADRITHSRPGTDYGQSIA